MRQLVTFVASLTLATIAGMAVAASAVRAAEPAGPAALSAPVPAFSAALSAPPLAAPAAVLSSAPLPAPLKAVAPLDLPRYMGTWHEVARYPNRFQKNCVGFTKASYRPKPDGTVEVINQCLNAEGETEVATGQARQIGGATSAMLKVRFAPSWLSFLPMVWGDYCVIDLDPAYSLVAVSEPEREYLWILSRDPKPEASSYQALLQRLRLKGFDTNRLLLTPQ